MFQQGDKKHLSKQFVSTKCVLMFGRYNTMSASAH